jgi:chemotaxis family two-component system response regulator Rcp1
MPAPFEILLVEDSPSDVALTREALRLLAGADLRLHVVSDGVCAMAFLRREDAYRGAPRPDLVLLDLNMPRKDGREVLAEVKGDPDLRRIPVVVLTSSSADSDVRQAYDLHANAYVAKPTDFTQFRALLAGLVTFWFRLARLPPR